MLCQGHSVTGPSVNSPEGVKSGNGVKEALDDAEQSEEPRCLCGSTLLVKGEPGGEGQRKGWPGECEQGRGPGGELSGSSHRVRKAGRDF